jgi:hypothetical protein
MIHEIKSSDWQAFCQRVTEHRNGAAVELEIVEPGGRKTEHNANMILQSMAFSAKNACCDVIALSLRGPKELIHEILDPIQVLLRASKAAGDFNLIQIEAENGITNIKLNPAIRPDMLVGM